MNCGDIQLKLAQHTEITPVDAAAIETHLTTCALCRSLVGELETQTEQWFALLGQTDTRPSAALQTTVRSHIIGPPRNRTQFWQPRHPIFLGLVVLVVMVLVWVGSARWSRPPTEPILHQAQNSITSVTPTRIIAREQPSDTPIVTVDRDDRIQPPASDTAEIPTNNSRPLETATNVPPILTQPLPTEIRPIVNPPEDPPVLPTMSPIATLEPLPTKVSEPSPDLPTDLPSTIAPVIPSTVPESTERPTRTPPINLPTAIATPALPTAIGTPAPPPTAIATPALPTAIGTPAPPTAIATPALPTAIGTPAPPPTASPTTTIPTTTIVPTLSPTIQPFNPTPTSENRSSKYTNRYVYTGGLDVYETIVMS